VSAAPRPKLRPLRQEITDLPNLITLSRIALIPLVVVWIDDYSPGWSAISCLVFLVAALSDALDGWLARRLGLVTVVGKFLDPLADKLIVLSTLVALVAHERVPAWLVILLMSRELAVTTLRAIASQEGFVIAAGAGGKAKTALQLVGISFLLVHFDYPLLGFDRTLDFHQIGIYLLYLSLIMSVLSAAEYFKFFVDAAARQAEELAARGLDRKRLRERMRRRRAKLRALKRARRKARRPGAARQLPRAPSEAGTAESNGGEDDPDDHDDDDDEPAEPSR